MHRVIGKTRISYCFAQEGEASRSESQLFAQFMTGPSTGDSESSPKPFTASTTSRRAECLKFRTSNAVLGSARASTATEYMERPLPANIASTDASWTELNVVVVQLPVPIGIHKPIPDDPDGGELLVGHEVNSTVGQAPRAQIGDAGSLGISAIGLSYHRASSAARQRNPGGLGARICDFLRRLSSPQIGVRGKRGTPASQ